MDDGRRDIEARERDMEMEMGQVQDQWSWEKRNTIITIVN